MFLLISAPLLLLHDCRLREGEGPSAVRCFPELNRLSGRRLPGLTRGSVRDWNGKVTPLEEHVDRRTKTKIQVLYLKNHKKYL